MKRPIDQWHVASITLWHTPGEAAFEGGHNAGLDDVLRLLEIARERGTPGIQVIDASGWGPKERWGVYVRHAVGAAW